MRFLVILSMIVLGFGLYWVNEGNKENKKINSHKFEPKTMTSLSPCNTKQPEAQNFRLVFLVVASQGAFPLPPTDQRTVP